MTILVFYSRKYKLQNRHKRKTANNKPGKRSYVKLRRYNQNNSILNTVYKELRANRYLRARVTNLLEV